MPIDFNQSSNAMSFDACHVLFIDISGDNSDTQPRYFEYPQINVNSDFDKDVELYITSVDPQPKNHFMSYSIINSTRTPSHARPAKRRHYYTA